MGDFYLHYFYSDEEKEEEEDHSRGNEIDENQEEEEESQKELEKEGDEDRTDEDEADPEEKQDNRREKQTSQILIKKAAQVRSRKSRAIPKMTNSTSNKSGRSLRKRHAPYSKPNEKDADGDDTVQRTRSTVKTRTLSCLQDKQQEDSDTEPMKEQPWTSFEIKHLRQAVIFIPKDHPEFWDLVQQMVVTKTKEECQEQHRKDVVAGEQLNPWQASTADIESENQDEH